MTDVNANKVPSMSHPLQARKWLITATQTGAQTCSTCSSGALRVTPGRHSFKDPNKLWVSAANLTQWQRHNFGSGWQSYFCQRSVRVPLQPFCEVNLPSSAHVFRIHCIVAAVVDIKQSSTAVSTSVVIDKRKPTKGGICAWTVAFLGSSFSG